MKLYSRVSCGLSDQIARHTSFHHAEQAGALPAMAESLGVRAMLKLLSPLWLKVARIANRGWRVAETRSHMSSELEVYEHISIHTQQIL